MIILQLLILFVLVYIIYILSYSMINGAPYAALSQKRVTTMFELLKPLSGKRLVDLGSGDGRIVIAAANRKLDAHGYEINLAIFLLSLINTKRRNSKVKIILSDYWKQDLSSYDYVTIWGTPFIMKRLEKKLLKELKKGAKVATNHYKFPNWKYTKYKNGVYLYVKN